MIDLNGFLHFVGFDKNDNQDDFDCKEQSTNTREKEG